MADELATIVVTPREQFSKARRSLESIFACTNRSVPIVYVDANSPPAVARYLKQQASQRGFTLLRSEQYLTANEARNLALPHVHTKYVAFVDNDVSVTPGWLTTLLTCAEDTGASAVGPLYLIGDPAKQIIHMAGAELKIVEEHGSRFLHERHRFSNLPLARVRAQLVREPTDLIEFHCMLVRKDVLDRVGPLDEQLRSVLDHVDFCLAIAGAGGSIFIEPEAIVTHLAPPPYALYDLPYFFLRFSDAWLEPSVRRFAEKHGLAFSDAEFDGHRRFRSVHRLRLLRRTRGAIRRLFGKSALALADNLTNMFFDRVVEPVVAGPMERRRRLDSRR